MDKTILQDYIDACELVKETEAEIRKLDRKKRTVVQTNVKGSSPDFPYIPQHFKIQGTTFTVKDDSHLRYEEKALAQRKARAEEVRLQVDEWLLTVPIRMQRIIPDRYTVQVPGGPDMGAGGHADGEEGYGGQRKEGAGKIF